MRFKARKEYVEMLNKSVMTEFQSSIKYFLQYAKMEKLLRKESQRIICLKKRHKIR